MVSATQNIIHWRNRLKELGTEDIPILEKLVDERPWCAAYRILLAKCHFNEKSTVQEHKLQLAALYSGNRERLYNLINDLREDENLHTTKTEHLLNTPEERASDILQHPEPKEISPPAYDPAIALRALIKKEESITKNPKTFLPPDTIIYNPEKELGKWIEEEEKPKQDHDFIFWLNRISKSSEEKPVHNPSSDPGNAADLLQKFLSSDKGRKPAVKKEFYKPENMAKQSETDRLDMVTESLAKIYAKQELHEKAIAVYQKLSLQNPEKSAYFAARITELKYAIKHKEK